METEMITRPCRIPVFDVGPKGNVAVPVALDGVSELTINEIPVHDHFADEPFMENFIIASSEIFNSVQAKVKELSPDLLPPSISSNFSQSYRALILELVTNYRKQDEITAAQVYSDMEFLWHFGEIMFLSSHESLPILPYYNEWIEQNFDETKQLFDIIANELPDLCRDSEKTVWEIVFHNVFHGRTDASANFLQLVLKCSHNSHDSMLKQQIRQMTELLEKRPKFNPSKTSPLEYEGLLHHWIQRCSRALEQNHFYGNENLIFLCKILIGDDGAFQEVKKKGHVGSWHEYLALVLNYKAPTLRPGGLKRLAKEIKAKFGGNDLITDQILFDAMDLNILKYLKEIQRIWENSWFSLHFVDLIVATGIVPSLVDVPIDIESVVPIREDLFRSYGSCLMEHQSFWRIGLNYLEACKSGPGVIEECLQRIQFQDESEAQNLCQIAEQYRLLDEVHSICKQMSLRYLNDQKKNKALHWAIKGCDAPLITYIVNKIVMEGTCEFEPSELESIRNCSPCVNSLIFLSAYIDFQESMKKSEYNVAIACLCKLIKEDIIPKSIIPKIVENMSDILRTNTMLKSSETAILMEFVQRKMKKHNSIEKSTSKEFSLCLMKMRKAEMIDAFSELRE